MGRAMVQNVLLPCVVFVCSMLMTAGAWASSQSGAISDEDYNSHWLPWIGSWQLVSDAEDTSALKDQYLLTTSPGGDGKSVIMKGSREGQELFEEKIEADGVRRSIEKDGCEGWQSYEWSGTGKRLLFQGESDCPGNLHQSSSGISLFDGNGDWLDIQLLQSGEEKTITIRRYRSVDADAIAPGRATADLARVARVYAGTDFTIDEIIELSGKVAPEVLEAALVELHKPFPINSKEIVRLADSGVPTQIVDLMVALSFPDEFVVERTSISRVEKHGPRQVYRKFWPHDYCWSCFHPMFPWLCGASIYAYYDYWYLDRYYWPGWYYYSWWYPGYYYGGSGYGVTTGRLVKGHGYTQVYPNDGSSPARYAQPRYVPTGQGSVSQQASSYSSSTSSSSYSSGSSTSSVSSYPSASPNGYSSGN